MDFFKLVPVKHNTKLPNIKALQQSISITKDVFKQDLDNVTLTSGVEKVEQTAAVASHKINLKVRTYLKLRAQQSSIQSLYKQDTILTYFT